MKRNPFPAVFWNILSTADRKPGMRKKCLPVLLSGHHANVEAWRREQSIYRTARWRPDLLKKADLSNKEWNQIRQWRKQWKEESQKAEDKE